MTDAFDKLLWAYRAVFTQTAGGGGGMAVQFTANERTVILFGTVGPDDYAAARSVNGYITDGVAVIGRTLESISIDNVKVPFPATGEGAAVTSESVSEFDKKIILGKGDALSFVVAATIQNETLTITIRALIRDWPPTVTTIGSAGTVTVTETYNEVR